jgi:hypothetical protein
MLKSKHVFAWMKLFGLGSNIMLVTRIDFQLLFFAFMV